MNISPVNKTEYNVNPAFKQVYRIQVNRSFFDEKMADTEVWKTFTHAWQMMVKNIIEDKVDGILRQKNFFKKIKQLSDHAIHCNSVLLEETKKLSIFRNLQKATGFGPWWLPNHLRMDEPKPRNEKYHTFSLYTNEEYKGLKKLFSKSSQKKMFRENMPILQQNRANGKYQEYDLRYWRDILGAESLDNKILEIEAKSKSEIEQIVIDSPLDIENFYYKLKNEIIVPKHE